MIIVEDISMIIFNNSGDYLTKVRKYTNAVAGCKQERILYGLPPYESHRFQAEIELSEIAEIIWLR